ncbi:NADH-ubiquinone oxidoreductase-F iron-sulfur binding region domain-containing protein [Rhodoferax sp.]|uniref:NADH-ubiquinone oxidoreductase-F iron-sulfur binding region domain-containing protein n=1 Tax=Rhodoferax sp. TaxID=50421 RepID=UPI00271F4E3C|nr:NADH-ubiquinone oxidoreductase-F iron-sulfur binding region domain-containing protein [Rhodoferax sp.]MDO8320142.1 NADH-ubiquinone oxidoreductase-F iron-sulfur binding region domain-containing protein [Rhodoferax sp.]MDP2678551.1 NADH-ubiquinone oxidoreductase-F iron-sulfur binding region domain-containing protein [Rhodoferax sp.]
MSAGRSFNEKKTIALATVDEMRERIRRKSKLKGRQVDKTSLHEVRALMDGAPHRRDLLIEYLHKLNDAFLCLHDRHLVALAKEMNIPMAEVYEAATFYHHFNVVIDDAQVPGLTIRVCDGLSCELAGSKKLLACLHDLLGSADVRVIPVPCLGRCEQAPVAVVHQCPVPLATANTVVSMARSAAVKHPDALGTTHFVPSLHAQESISPLPQAIQVSPDFAGYDTYRAHGGYSLAAALANGEVAADRLIKTMEDSGLRGLGGAGFPAGRKWRIVREQPAPRLMAVNIDEGEPGTFKDRTYLERDPHRFLEGLLIAAQVVGIDACYVYLRDEYHGCRAILETELAKLQANPPYPCHIALPTIELRRGAGAYICGEESAMIESIEGKRGEPRMRPPYIAQVGLFGRPTLEHNFETLYWVRDIVEKGADWFSGFGRHGRQGLRSFSVSGRVKHPGVKLAPAGITLQELIDEYCDGMLDGHTLYAYLPGGASGGILPASLNNIPLDFDTLQPYGCFIGSAAIIVLSQHDRARDAALNMMRFFSHESCGQCTPCRVGTTKAVKLMEAAVWDNTTLEDLNIVMTDASICGLGQAAPNPVRSIQRYFPQEIV